ncbi:Gfo/Idh/MocA family protein [Planctomycetota bacterium]
MRNQKKNVARTKVSRREILSAGAAVAAFTIVPRHVLAGSGQQAPSDKLNIGSIGCGGMQGGQDIDGVSSENIYALCDVDERQGGAKFVQYPNAKLYKDFRKMVDREQSNLDAVTVTIPDHNHTQAVVWAMERGLGVYCQKPLTKYVWEARLIRKAQEKYNVPTQMGNQGYSAEATRLACEIIWNGDLGDITEVHSRQGSRGPGFGQRLEQWPAPETIPAELNWDLWLGCSSSGRTYTSRVLPNTWRGFVDFGSGILGDWGFHNMGPANWGLRLGSPISVQCLSVEGLDSINWSDHDVIKWDFPARGEMPPVSVYWHHGGSGLPIPPGLTGDDIRSFNQVFYGSKGYMGTSGRGEAIDLIPASRRESYVKPPQVLPRSPGHYAEWIQSCKSGEPASSNFSIAGLWAEWITLGNLSLHFPGETLMWDPENLRITNNDKANEYIRPDYLKGWELSDIT